MLMLRLKEKSNYYGQKVSDNCDSLESYEQRVVCHGFSLFLQGLKASATDYKDVMERAVRPWIETMSK